MTTGIPKTHLSAAGWAGVRRFERLRAAIDASRDGNGDLKHDQVRELVRAALGPPVLEPADRAGFAIALAAFLAMIADGWVPDHGAVGKALKRGEFADPSYAPLPEASAEVNLAIRRILGR